MATWRFHPLLFILLILGLTACDRPLGDAGDLPTIAPTTALGGADGDPEVGGGQGEVAEPTAAATLAPSPEPTEAAETTPRETAEATEAAEAVEPAATSEPALSPTPAAEGETEAVAEEETTEQATEESAADTDAADEAAAEVVPSPVAEQDASAAPITPASPQTHTVAPGENLYRIGLRYGLSWLVIAQANGLTDANRITVGQVLVIPANGTSGQPTPGTGGQPTPGTGGQPTPSPQTETTHTVRPGDNLFRIGLTYGVGWVQIAEANGLVSPSQIYVGQVLKIPVSKPGPMPEFTHQVRPGENLQRIALLYGIPWTTIAQANDLSSPYIIYPTQVLIIPGQ